MMSQKHDLLETARQQDQTLCMRVMVYLVTAEMTAVAGLSRGARGFHRTWPACMQIQGRNQHVSQSIIVMVSE